MRVKLADHARFLLLFAIPLLLACGLAPGSINSLWPLPAPTPEPSPTAAEYTIGPASPRDGLDELESYRANLIVEFDGLRNGQPAAGQIESLAEITRPPPTFHHYLKTEIIPPTAEIANGVSEFFLIDNTVYAKKADEDGWLTFTNRTDSTVTPLDFLELDRLIILPLTVSTPPQPETLNGLSVQHYTFNQNHLMTPNIVFEQAQGDLWVATSGNFLMQYVISATVKIVTPIPKAHIFDRGQLTLRYSLTGINADFTITPPAGALPGHNPLNHLPRLPDAEILTVFPTLIEYTSATGSISATLFYRDELATREWTENSAAIFNEKSQLTYSKEDQTLTIIITPTDHPGKIRVMLSID
jgi:hypothetical protein